ncbi:MAG: hypothetical protein ACLQO1_09075 [Steroidobacteraceae bacterium]
MSDSKAPTRSAEVNRRKPPIGTEAAHKPAANVPKNADKTRGRHAAITNNLNNWSSYKNWVEKIRGTWVEKR